MKGKILLAISLFIILSLAFFAYPVIKNRYFQSGNISTDEENTASEKNKKNIFFGDSKNTSDIDNDTDNTPDDSAIDEDIFIEIEPEDCEDNCSQFEDVEDKKYCLNYCGLGEVMITYQCEDLVDLEKDYCYKDQALAEKNYDFCKKIVDKRLMEACQNRLTEELINSSNSPL